MITAKKRKANKMCEVQGQKLKPWCTQLLCSSTKYIKPEEQLCKNLNWKSTNFSQGWSHCTICWTSLVSTTFKNLQNVIDSTEGNVLYLALGSIFDTKYGPTTHCQEWSMNTEANKLRDCKLWPTNKQKITLQTPYLGVCMQLSVITTITSTKNKEKEGVDLTK